ncbi:uncharacterized protein Dmul_34310 [Desulfococcus multivorans]|nr:uncharacterized protein Dmul_34310 [Desulfococcus multivorans]
MRCLSYDAFFGKSALFEGRRDVRSLEISPIPDGSSRPGRAFSPKTDSICFKIIIIGLTIFQEKGMFPYDAIIGY